MRTAKDKVNVPKRYYRPEMKRCPQCQGKLKRGSKLWHKYLVTMSGRFYVISHGYHCSNPDCPEAAVVYASQEAEALSLPDCSYGLDVIVEVGYQRFWQQRTVSEIHGHLTKQIPISERQVLNLLANFLALLRAGQATKVAQLHPAWHKLGGLVLSIDGLQPEKGNPALYVVREVQLDVTLMAEILATGGYQTIAAQLLKPIKAWGLPIKGIVSDAQESLRLAVRQVYPGQPHQNCQFHCLKEAGRPTYEADRALKTQLKKTLRGRLNRAGQTIKQLPDHDPYRAVLLKYVAYLRFTLVMRGLAPFDLAGLSMVQQLATLEASLARAQKKASTGSLNAYSSWRACIGSGLTKRPVWPGNGLG